MKSITQLLVAALPWLLFLFTSSGFCQRVNCEWGPFGDWSECDGCTNLQSRYRSMAVYAQFYGNPCGGERTETRPCKATKSCPLGEGCGDRFRCRSGQCVSKSLVCNGDQDCEEDGLDESNCREQSHYVCQQESIVPPNIELLGLGVDVVTGKKRGTVINTKSFGGRCIVVFSGVHKRLYRLPLSVIQFNFMVKASNDFSEQSYESEWNYANDIVKRETISGTTKGYRNYDYHETYTKSQIQKLVVLKNEIEVAQFQSNAPRYLPISEEFWKALAKLPSVYDYSAYRKVLERFGTHYVSEGSFGGSLNAIVKIDDETEKHVVSEVSAHRECETVKRWFLFFPITKTVCRSDPGPTKSINTGSSKSNRVDDVDVIGGGTQHIAALESIQFNNPEKNWEIYSNWADSLQSFPAITKEKYRPLSELVKDIQCAAVKKHYLRRAIEEYLSESDPCHCRPCRNNGLAVINNYQCICICKPGTDGAACETGTEAEGQPGVIHGSWSCWSAWSTCSGGRKSRTRSCSNPPPQNSGQHCTGESRESTPCEDEDLQYLRNMEPQCFDQTLPASQKCGAPPALINGYILDPKDIYLVGGRVEYTCIEGFHLVGPSTLQCTAEKNWSTNPGVCVASRCKLPTLGDGVIASPFKLSYDIGEAISLSCPEGRQLVGEATVICDPSLNLSPDPGTIKCNAVRKPEEHIPQIQCKLWEKPARGKCVCKLPNECPSSLELCSTLPGTTKYFLVSVCKMHAMQCQGRNLEIVEDSACTWPQRDTTGCTNCHMWETCDAQTNRCRCKDSAECSRPGLNVCVRIGENGTDVQQNLGECEAGIRRCKGEMVSVVSIHPCAT